MEQSQEMLDDAEELDIDIASGIAAQMIFSDEGQKVIVNALKGQNPVETLGVFYAQLIEMIQTQSQQTDMPLSPRIWLVPGGVLEESLDDIEKVAKMNNVPVDILEIAEPMRQEVMKLVQKRGEQLSGEGQQQQGAPQQQAAPVGGPSLMGMANQQGGAM